MKIVNIKIRLLSVCLFLIFSYYSEESLADSMIERSHFEFFKEAVQASGYQCATCEGGHALGGGYKGQLFRVYCNDNVLKYRVVIGQKYLCVEPWDTKTQRCE